MPAEVSSVQSVRGCGAVDGDLANFLSCVALSAGEARFTGVAAIEAWLSARATVEGLVLSCGMANLDQVASVDSSLLRLCGGSVASFTGAVGPSVFASHTTYSYRCGSVRAIAYVHVDRTGRMA